MSDRALICLWYESDAESAARFYAETFPDSSVGKTSYAPADNPSSPAGAPLTVEFTVMGLPCLGLNGGQESMCGWCKDQWGVSWQITPRVLSEAMSNPDKAAAKRAFEAMMQMKKIDVAAIEAALRG
ncbi:MAG: hypothetical protein B7Z08_12965 [Sphingomonadales bacterium 32-68-7]|nr:MAG: hypothetical protein B7Z08_12965 [Sphingomonadales bacterium 32-68-7]